MTVQIVSNPICAPAFGTCQSVRGAGNRGPPA